MNKFNVILALGLIVLGVNAKEISEQDRVKFEKEKQLYSFVRKNDLSNVSSLLDEGINVNALTRDNKTPLHVLVNMHFRDHNKRTLTVNGKKTEDKEPSCSIYRLEMIKLLVEKGADINLVSKENETAISLAFKKKKMCLVKYFLKKGAESKKGINPLFYVDWRYTVDEVKMMKRHGYSLSEVSEKVLFTLVRHGFNQELITLFLENGADINAKNKQGETMLLVSLENRERGVTNFLLSKGAKKTDDYDATELYGLLSRGNSHKVKKFLLIHSKLLENKSIHNEAILISSKKSLSIFKLVVDGLKSKNWSNLIYAKALKNAMVYKKSEIVNYLLEQELNLKLLPDNKKSSYKRSILGLASESGNVEIVKKIIKRGYSVKKDKGEGIQPLLLATKNGHLEVVKLLKEEGADMSIKDFYDGSLLKIATANNDKKMIAFFKSL